MRRFLTVLAAALGLTYLVVAIGAPRPTGRGRTVDDLVREARASGAEGAALVDVAMRTVAEAMPYHSAWHLWERPQTALRHGRGWAHQYNTVLLLVLRELGFEVQLVHAATSRGFGHPWFLSGHTWVRVAVGGRWQGACASSPENRLGSLPFVPTSRVIPVRIRTRWAVALALSPFVVASVWRSWLLREPVPAWVYGERAS